MKKPILLLTFIAIALFEVGFLNYFNIFGARPNLLLICMVAVSLSFNLGWAILFSIILGLLKDTFQISPYAINFILFPMCSFFIIKLSRKMSFDTDILCALLVFVVVVLQNIAARIIFVFSSKPVMGLGLFSRLVFIEAFYTAILVPVLLKILKIRTQK